MCICGKRTEFLCPQTPPEQMTEGVRNADTLCRFRSGKIYFAGCGLIPRASSSSCAAEIVEGESIIMSRPELFFGNAM